MSMIYRNKKNQKLYSVVNMNITDATNNCDGKKMVLYHPNDNATKMYVREYTEFLEKFEFI